MKAGWTRLGAIATVTVAVVALGAGGAIGASGKNTLKVTLDDYPGPSEVTYTQNVASTLTVQNASSNIWNTVIVTIPLPTNTDGEKATLMALVCPAGTGSEVVGQQSDVVCNLGTLTPNQTYTFLIVWKTWASGTSAGCSSCFITTATVTGSDSTSSSRPKPPRSTFPVSVSTPLLDTPDVDKDKAGTFALLACSDSSQPTLTTKLGLDKTNNPFSTSVCVPELDPAFQTPGIPVFISESENPPAGAKIGVSTICIPRAPDRCGPTYTPFTFTAYATFTFVVSNGSFNGKLTTVLYDPDDDGPAPFAEVPLDAPAVTGGPYVVGITPDNPAGITTIVVKSKQNGRWTGT